MLDTSSYKPTLEQLQKWAERDELEKCARTRANVRRRRTAIS